MTFSESSMAGYDTAEVVARRFPEFPETARSFLLKLSHGNEMGRAGFIVAVAQYYDQMPDEITNTWLNEAEKISSIRDITQPLVGYFDSLSDDRRSEVLNEFSGTNQEIANYIANCLIIEDDSSRATKPPPRVFHLLNHGIPAEIQKTVYTCVEQHNWAEYVLRSINQPNNTLPVAVRNKIQTKLSKIHES
jgi:hypothetical protein